MAVCSTLRPLAPEGLLILFLGHTSSLDIIAAKETALFGSEPNSNQPGWSLNSEARDQLPAWTVFLKAESTIHLTARYGASVEKLIVQVMVCVVPKPCSIIVPFSDVFLRNLLPFHQVT